MDKFILVCGLSFVAGLLVFAPKAKADEKDGLMMVCASAGEVERGDYSLCHRIEPDKYVTLGMGLCKMTDNQARVCDPNGKNCYGGFMGNQFAQ
jgi:hypothetical protein